ncbi:TIGR01457 family HAD-type hydrolase [Lottiidibacillus patelloidae]|uniref:TIGR01457 family HAD-type hydrolase n=1 Tax=Lottiidibacillus patelloidae TaxID=2670334 RepID=A0A263BQH7_9BACI|nr:TIGR01457 family HAD-type hydrolase [Lottiidibacillus patelloidae]OZM55963.1 TIGR01457 family HAD-type hydrolase [Lottiidibacillus patelloidae]
MPYKAYLIDLDGTMYLGEQQIEAASDFVKLIKERNLPLLFVTNNSSAKPENVAKKLNDFDIPALEQEVLTSSMAAASYIADQKQGASVYMIGEEGLEHALTAKGLVFDDENPDFVVMGIDREVTYEKFAKACLAVRKGATFLSTNPDAALPTERGFLPGNGSLTSVVHYSTGVTPTYIGKPEAIMIEQALKQLNVRKEEAIMVGDNYATDIMAGINAGVDTLLVYTGVTTKEHLSSVEKMPTFEIQSLNEWKFDE